MLQIHRAFYGDTPGMVLQIRRTRSSWVSSLRDPPLIFFGLSRSATSFARTFAMRSIKDSRGQAPTIDKQTSKQSRDSTRR